MTTSPLETHATGARHVSGTRRPTDADGMLQAAQQALAGRVNHYLATFAGFLYWCKQNHFCAEGLSKHCTRFTKSNKAPELMKAHGCAVMGLAVHTKNNRWCLGRRKNMPTT